MVCKSIHQYRRPFFDLLRSRLAQNSIQLEVIYGQPSARDVTKNDTIRIEWAHSIHDRAFRFRGRELYWQPCLKYLKGADLIIVEQHSRLLLNYFLQARYLAGGARVALWGHGKNFDGRNASRVGEFVKRKISRHVHWWFAYNAISAEVVRSLGFPAERTTHTANAIDTISLTAGARALQPSVLDWIRAELQLSGRNVCVYAGAMYPEKRLPFLLEACELIRQSVPDFEMILIGAGVDAPVAIQGAKRHSWIKYVGQKFDDDKVPYFLLSKLFLLPGVVGLAVLDAFALSVPLVTTAVQGHGPEVGYLNDGHNGIIVQQSESPAAYAAAVTDLLTDETRRRLLVAGCQSSAHLYTIENMVERFATGIGQALAS